MLYEGEIKFLRKIVSILFVPKSHSAFRLRILVSQKIEHKTQAVEIFSLLSSLFFDEQRTKYEKKKEMDEKKENRKMINRE